jgi:hypothetical protein
VQAIENGNQPCWQRVFCQYGRKGSIHRHFKHSLDVIGRIRAGLAHPAQGVKTAAMFNEAAHDLTHTGRACLELRPQRSTLSNRCFHRVKFDEVDMQNLAAKLFLTLIAFTLVTDESSAKRLRSDGSVGQEVQIERQQVVPSSMLKRLQPISSLGQPSLEPLPHAAAARPPSVPSSLAVAQRWAERLDKDTLDGASIGFGFGSFMSSGNAQRAVNQESQREESAKQENARKKATAKEPSSQESASKRSSTETSGESGKGNTASGTGASPKASPSASDNW